jgi:hypothetical protein
MTSRTGRSMEDHGRSAWPKRVACTLALAMAIASSSPAWANGTHSWWWHPTTTTTHCSTTTTTTHCSTTTTTTHCSTTTTTTLAPTTTTTTAPSTTTLASTTTTSTLAPTTTTTLAPPTTTSTTLAPTTTTTTAPPTTTTTLGPVTTTTTTSVAPSTTTTTLPVAEICGNCLDDDGNGLTDFEDPACCVAPDVFAMKRIHGKMVPRRNVEHLNRFRFRSSLASSHMWIDPMHQDVYVQLSSEMGEDVFCARIPAKKFMKRGRKFMFWDRKHQVKSAVGLHDMTISTTRKGRVHLRTHGPRVSMADPKHGPLHVVVAFWDPAKSEAQCSMAMSRVQFRHHGLVMR